MKTSKNIFLFTALMIAATSCDYLKSFYPFFSQDTVIEVNSLQGKYEAQWEEAKGENSNYILKISDLVTALESNAAEEKVDELVLDNELTLNTKLAQLLSALPAEFRGSKLSSLDKVVAENGYIFLSIPHGIEKKGLRDKKEIMDIQIQVMVPIELGQTIYFDVYAYTGALVSENGSHYKYDQNKEFNIDIHRIAKVDFSYGRLSWNFLNNGFVSKGLKDNRFKLDHLRRGQDDQLLITAATEDLQEFVIKHARDEDAFDGPAKVIQRVFELAK